MENSPILPLELLDDILDHLWDDPRALAACSLASRMWLPTTRFHLFDTVPLDDPTAHELFCRLTKESPDIASYVRHLSVDQRAVRRKGRASFELMLPAASSKLDRLHHLTLKNFSALALPEETKQLIRVFYPEVRTLSFVDCKFEMPLLVDTLGAFPQLTGIHLDKVQMGDRRNLFDFTDPDSSIWLDTIPFSTTVPSSETMQIDDLSMSLTSPNVGALLSKAPFKLHTRKLELTCYPQQTRCVRALLAAAGPYLEHFTFSAMSRNFLARETMPEECLDLSNNKELVSVHLNGVLIDTSFMLQSHWAHNALATLQPSHERLCTVQLGCMLIDCAHAPLLRWARFDAAFARLAREHPGITFALRLSTSYTYSQRGVDFRVWARQVVDSVGCAFPSLLSEKGQLRVTCCQVDVPRGHALEEVEASFPPSD